MTYDEMITLLVEGGINVATFNERGAKTLFQLWEEVRDGEARVVVRPAGHGQLGHNGSPTILRISHTSKLLIRTATEGLAEAYRIYPGGKRVVKNMRAFKDIHGHVPPYWTMSETRRRDETAFQCMLRGLSQEWKIELGTSAKLDFTTWRQALASKDLPLRQVHLFPLPIPHTSSTYPDTETLEYATWFEWRLKERAPENEVMIYDGDVEIHLEWKLLD